ncbi:FACT complex subunit Ssrp1 [Diaphorina citri]|uniref:FACT complex subunit SSRP1 n=1 Tax=Diaphorina citri TaxID=121845 RepID=A0A1S3DIE7_DIACI|nr:FACT complex subunit Ssrp1 [Diaphorina citri]
MTEALEFQEVSSEFRGALCPGKLKITDQNIVFKNKKTGKVEQINGPDLDFVNWQKLVGTWALRIFLKNGSLHRFAGFKETEIDKICSFFKTNFKIDVPEKELSVRGWNWGGTKFIGNVLSFDVNNTTAFEIPLRDVSQCTTGKNEVTVEFHPNDEAAESLIEMRFYIPTNEIAGDTDPVEAFKDSVMNQASVINATGDAIAVFNEIQCLTPRGRYDIKIFNSFFQLHGKTFDYKIPISTVLRMFTLPHKDGRQNFFVISLDPPIKQGQTRYHFLTLLFNQDETSEMELPFSEQELKEKYEGKLDKELSGPTYEVMAKIMKVIVNRKITVPGSFRGHTGTSAVTCSYKAAAGYIYPLERGFIFIHKPPIHIRFEEIATVNFARSGGSTRSFDFEIELKSGVLHTFSSIEKEEYGKLFDFIREKKLRVKNTGKGEKPNYKEDFGSSDDEKEPDAYLARVKREAAERDDEDDEDEDESTDEDFNPDQAESDVAEEYDSNPTPTDSDEDSDASEGTKKKKKEKSRKTITISEKPRKSKKDKESSGGSTKRKKKDKNAPKKPMSAYMMWFNDMREKIKKDNPGISFTEIAKKGGELWKTVSSKEKAEYDEKVNKAKEDYNEALKAYKESGGGQDSDDGKTSKSKKPAKKKETASTAVSPHKVKSKEFIESNGSSSDSDDDKKASSKRKRDSDEDSKAKTKKKKEKSESESDSGESEKEKKSKSKPKGDKSKSKSKKEDEIDDEEYDEPVESTPPSSDAGSDASSSEDDD